MADLNNLIDLLSGTKNRFASMKIRKLFSLALPPPWMRSTDHLMGLYFAQLRLLRKGRIVMGVIVQANTRLFAYDRDDCPANVLYSMHPYYLTDEGVAELQRIAHKVYSLKQGDRGDAEETAVGELLANETSRCFNVKLPYHLTGGREVFLTTIMVHRRLLPVPFLRSGWFPLIVLPAKTKYVLICPAVFWEKRLARNWSLDPEEWIES